MQTGKPLGALAYHDPVYAEDGSAEGGDTGDLTPIATNAPVMNTGLLVMLGILLLLIAMSEED